MFFTMSCTTCACSSLTKLTLTRHLLQYGGPPENIESVEVSDLAVLGVLPGVSFALRSLAFFLVASKSELG